MKQLGFGYFWLYVLWLPLVQCCIVVSVLLVLVLHLRSVHALVMNVCQQTFIGEHFYSVSTVKQYPAHGDPRLILHRAYDIIVMVWCFASTSPIVSFGSLSIGSISLLFSVSWLCHPQISRIFGQAHHTYFGLLCTCIWILECLRNTLYVGLQNWSVPLRIVPDVFPTASHVHKCTQVSW